MAEPIAAPLNIPGFSCPRCGSLALPQVKERISTSGVVAFIVLLVICFPLCWIGLLVKEQYRVCSSCAAVLDP
jgi:predicted RNA-binding Zn-ribbon protein involved in translation (DUF1610 family)